MRCPDGAAAFVVLAGGSGSRLSTDRNKVYLPLAGRPVLSWSLSWAARVPAIGPVVLVRRPEDADLADEAVTAAGLESRVEQVAGGGTRHASEQAALDALRTRIGSAEVRVVAIHDGARPLAGAPLLARVLDAAAEYGGAVPTVPARGVWRLEGTGQLRPPETVLHGVQTPQAFRAADLLAAFDAADQAGTAATDTAATVAAHSSLQVRVVPGSADNLKITYPADLEHAERLLARLGSRP